MPLLKLANELLQSIVQHLDSLKDINAFCQTNHRLYALLNTYLYHQEINRFGSSALLWAARYGHVATAKVFVAEVRQQYNMN